MMSMRFREWTGKKMKLEMCTWDRLLKGSESQVHSVDSMLWGQGAAEA